MRVGLHWLKVGTTGLRFPEHDSQRISGYPIET